MEGFAQNGLKTELYGPKRPQKPEKQEILETRVHGIQEVSGLVLLDSKEGTKIGNEIPIFVPLVGCNLLCGASILSVGQKEPPPTLREDPPPEELEDCLLVRETLRYRNRSLLVVICILPDFT